MKNNNEKDMNTDFSLEPDDPDKAEMIVIEVDPADFLFKEDSNDSTFKDSSPDNSDGDSSGNMSALILPSLTKSVTTRKWIEEIQRGLKTFDPRCKITCKTIDYEQESEDDSKQQSFIPIHHQFTRIVYGEGGKRVMAEVTGPNKDYLFKGEFPFPCSTTDEDTSTSGDEGSCPFLPAFSPVDLPDESIGLPRVESPKISSTAKNKFGKNTIPKSSKGSNSKNNSYVGEQTPDTVDVNETVNGLGVPADAVNQQSDQDPISMRLQAAYSPQSIRVRDMPLPDISFTDSTELSLLMCFKEDIGITERSPSVFRRTPNLSTRMRAILLDWLMEVCDVYKLRRVTYYLAVDYIDRYLSRTDEIPKNHLQLLGITCLFIAAKVEEIYPPKLVEMAYVTDGACTDADMLEKELDILTQLCWDVGPLTVTGWLCLYLQLACTKSNEIRGLLRRMKLKDNDVVYPQFSPHMFMTGSMLLDLCSLDDGMLQFKYSVIAASVIYYLQNREKALFVSGYTWDVLKPCVEWMLPFAMVVNRTLVVKPIVCPREYNRKGSALRVSNPSIILDEGHTLQNHLVNLKMLEEVYNEVKIMRDNFNTGKVVIATGWTISNEGYDTSYLQPSLPRRTSIYKQSSSRNDFRLHYTSNDEPEDEPEPVNSLPFCEDSEDEIHIPSVSGITPLKECNSETKCAVESQSNTEDFDRDLKDEAKTHYKEHLKTDIGWDWEKDFDEWWKSLFEDMPTLLIPSDSKDNGVRSSSSCSNDEDKDNDKSKSRTDIKKNRKRSRETDKYCSIFEEPLRKKSCCDKRKPCKQMLASPQCSGLYLKPGEKVNHRLLYIPPLDPVLPPVPVEPPKPADVEIKSEADLHAWWRAKLLQRRKNNMNDK